MNPNFTQEDESELLFLLRKIKHKNILELLATYVYDGIQNLLFWPADMDLHDFMLQSSRTPRFEEDGSILKAIQGLSSGLRHLHFFRLDDRGATDASTILYGIHQDIKPRNVLVKGTDFVLADFGLSRLKSVEEGSQTTFKDATYEYGAPECQDSRTWAQERIGRASDIWSFGCIVSELLIYMHKGLKGLQEFRVARVTQDQYGKQRAFHDGTRLKQQVRETITEVGETVKSLATSGVVQLLERVFEDRPTYRSDAKEVENRLERIVLQVHIQELLDTIAKLRIGIRTGVFQATISLESARFQAWAVALHLLPTRLESIDYNAQTPISFLELCETFDNTTESMKSPVCLEAKELDERFILSTLCQCNDKLYRILPKALSERANGLFSILFISDASASSFVSERNLAVQDSSKYEDTCRIAAIKYMSSLYMQETEDFSGSVKIQRFPVPKNPYSNNFQVQPEIYRYETEGGQQDVIVEFRSYKKLSKNGLSFDEVQKAVQPIFRRIQGLVGMLRKPRSSNLRALDCLGTYHDLNGERFGVVYGFPRSHSTPVRLHYLLKGGGSRGIVQPHIGLKIALARTLAACLQDVHLSGWVHKDINSYNILFFTSASQPSEHEYRNPYLTGFHYSREDDPNAITIGPDSIDETRHYQHPEYREGNGRTAFRREFDVYSLGLVLLEIGVWESLGGVYNHRPKSGLWELRDKYIRICDRQVLERMGPIYHAVTVRCLRAESQFRDEEDIDMAMDFQRNVIEKLESCRV